MKNNGCQREALWFKLKALSFFFYILMTKQQLETRSSVSLCSASFMASSLRITDLCGGLPSNQWQAFQFLACPISLKLRVFREYIQTFLSTVMTRGIRVTPYMNNCSDNLPLGNRQSQAFLPSLCTLQCPDLYKYNINIPCVEADYTIQYSKIIFGGNTSHPMCGTMCGRCYRTYLLGRSLWAVPGLGLLTRATTTALPRGCRN